LEQSFTQLLLQPFYHHYAGQPVLAGILS